MLHRFFVVLTMLAAGCVPPRTPEPTITATPTATPSPRPTDTALPTPTETPRATETPTPRPTATETVTPTMLATPCPSGTMINRPNGDLYINGGCKWKYAGNDTEGAKHTQDW